ncbi:44218_t:CDS:2, partial [Gigaspora margarita]
MEFGSNITWLENAILESQINFFSMDEFSEIRCVRKIGTIYKGQWNDLGANVALKNIIFNIGKIKSFIEKLKILQKNSFHPNILRFYGVTKAAELKNKLSEWYSDVSEGLQTEINDQLKRYEDSMDNSTVREFFKYSEQTDYGTGHMSSSKQTDYGT